MKKFMNLILFFVLTIFSCQHKEKYNEKKDNKIIDSKIKEFTTSKYFKTERIQVNKYNVKYSGDMSSYSELVLYYSYNKLRKEELLPYSLIMIEKHKNYSICTDIFSDLIEFYSEKENQFDGTQISLINEYKKIESLNEDQRNFCLYFVKLGAKNKDIASMNCLEVLYREGIGIEKNTIKADSIKLLLGSKRIFRK